jgi:hypothetical protein
MLSCMRPVGSLTKLGAMRQDPLLGTEKSMANRAIWSMRLRHEWLKTPLKKARFKKSQRIRVGLEDALQRKAKPQDQPKSA